VYLRVVSRSSLTVPVTLWSPTALHASDQHTYSILALYFGMLLALGTYNLLLYLSLRDSVYLIYVAFLASLAISQAGILGLAAQFLWPDWPRGGDLIRPAGYCLVGLFGALFSRRLLGVRDWAPRLDQLLGYTQLSFLTLAAGALITDWPFFTITATLLGAAFSFGAVGIGLLAVKKRVPVAALYLGGSMTLLIGASAFSLRMMGWVPTNFLTSNGMLIGSFFEMLLLSLSMANRIHGLQQSEVTLKQLAHHDPLTGLANRTQLTQQLQQAVVRRHHGRLHPPEDRPAAAGADQHLGSGDAAPGAEPAAEPGSQTAGAAVPVGAAGGHDPCRHQTAGPFQPCWAPDHR
jgi:hypothetical protein